jgi:geranylgeranyl transferase type-2 subunit beta
LLSLRSAPSRLTRQDLEEGGIADRPGDWVDVFHTVFGLAGELNYPFAAPYGHASRRGSHLISHPGLSLVGYPGLQDIDPVFCLPAKTIDKLGLRKTYRTLPRLASYPSS